MLIIRGPNGEDVKPCDLCESQKIGDCKDAEMWLRYGCCGAYKDWEQRQKDTAHFAQWLRTIVEDLSERRNDESQVRRLPVPEPFRRG